ncbi:MAG TPA: ribulose-phosphate 3-epimerase [Anaerolineales bacterium]|nr:ribulose-phosphate 3-epimerase [Anaerolineales bacterium]HRQ93171.1 ribulose-phosphate 3-epimerase [Anaerolineales bacterium]
MNTSQVLLPSVVSAPLLDMQAALAALHAAGVRTLHVDIEDGHFVPVMNLGTRLIEHLRADGRFTLDVHLMVSHPEVVIPWVVEAGAHAISFHYEASAYPRRHLHMIRQHGLLAGLAFNPKMPLPTLDYLQDCLDFVVILTTEPEEPDMPFLPQVLEKVRQARQWAVQHAPALLIVVDGGVSAGNIAAVLAAGADRAVAGRAVFHGGRIAENIAELQKAANI